jgi:hypothetical protein
MDDGTVPEGDQGTVEPQEAGSIFDPYLQSVPEGWDSPPQGSPREIVSNYLKDAEKNVNSKLRDAADLQTRFGDYKDVDLGGIAPQQLSQVLEFVQQVGSSPEAYQEWLRSEAEASGLLQQEQQQQDPVEDQDLETYIQSRIEGALSPVQQQLAQYDERFSANDQAQAQHEMETHIESTIAGLEAANDLKLTDEQQEAVLALGEQVEGKDWVEQGFAKYQALTGQAQASFVNGKTNQPTPALRTGGQAAPAKPKTFADVREAALELAQQAM